MKVFLLCLAGLGAVATASAQSFLTPVYRGLPDTAHSAWDVFASLTGGGPDVTGTVGTVSELSGAAFLTGGGNIYNAALPSSFVLDVSLDFPAESILLQTITLGTELNYGGVSLHYEDGFGASFSLSTTSTTELGRVALGGFGGQSVGTAFSWELGGAGITEFSLRFAATASHLSLDKLSLDVAGAAGLAAIPEPSSVGLWAGLGTLIFLLRRRCRR
jgi:hypothetical protein